MNTNRLRRLSLALWGAFLRLAAPAPAFALRRLGLVLLLALPAASARARAGEDDRWTPLVATGGAAYHTSLTAPNGDVYVGGDFTTIAGVAASGVARWDGGAWHAVGGPIAGRVYALAFYDGKLVAGGTFASVDGQSMGNLVVLDGGSWQPLGGGAPSVVYALGAYHGKLYAGGQFTEIGVAAAGAGLPANRVAAWDGAAWSALGDGANGEVRAFAAIGADLYMGGSFGRAGGEPVNGVARWDGADWSALGAGVGGEVFALATDGGDLYAGGSFQTAGAVAANYVARWDGADWSALGAGAANGVGDLVYALRHAGGALYAGGAFASAGGAPAGRAARWDGTAWSALGSGIAGAQVWSLGGSASELYVAGTYTQAGGKTARGFARYALAGAPVAADDAYETDEDAPLVVAAPGLFGNDAGAPTGFSIAAPPKHGALTPGVGGGFTYTPDADYNGPDSLSYAPSSAAGTGAPATVRFTVRPVNDAPTAAADAATTPEDTPVTVSVLANDTDLEGDALTLVSVAGAVGGTAAVSGAAVVFTPAPNFNGAAGFDYTVRDSQGASATARATVTVTPVNDVTTVVNDDYSMTEDVPLVVDAAAGVLANDADPDGPMTAELVTGPSHGTLALAPDGGFTYTPAANFFGLISFSYRALQGGVYSGPAVVLITVNGVNDPPTAADDAATTPWNTPVRIDVLANDADPEGPVTLVSVSNEAGGTAAIRDGQIDFTPTPGFSGVAGFDYAVRDGQGVSATAHVSVTVQGPPSGPTAAADAYETDEDTPLVVAAAGVLANDAPAGGGALAATLVTDVQHGVLTFGADGGFTYAPNADYNGPDSFTYTAANAAGTTPETVVAITVRPVNDAPRVTAAPPPVVVDEDAPPTVLQLSEYFADAEPGLTFRVSGGAPALVAPSLAGDELTLTYAPNAFGAATLTLTAEDADGATAEAMLAVTVRPVNDAPTQTQPFADVSEQEDAPPITLNLDTFFADLEGPLLYAAVVDAPARVEASVAGAMLTLRFLPNAFGAVAVTVTATDAGGLQAGGAFAVDLSPVNDAPAAADDHYDLAEDAALTLPAPGVLANDADADGDALRAAVAALPQHGVLTLGEGGGFTYTPHADYVGDDAFTYTASDGALTSAPATVTLTVGGENDAPVAADDAATTAEDTPVVINVLANDADADGDALTVAGLSSLLHGAAVVAGDQVVFTPAPDYYGPAGFDYAISDGRGGFATGHVSVDVTPVGDAPVLTPTRVAATEDDPAGVAFTLSYSDPDGGPLALAFERPAHGVLTYAGGVFTYVPHPNFSGADGFGYTVTDAEGHVAAGVVEITVAPAPDAPIFVQPPALNAFVGENFSFPVQVSDADGDPIMITASGLPSFLTYDAATRTLSGRATAADVGAYEMLLSAGGGEATLRVRLRVWAVRALTAVADTATTMEDMPAAIRVTANDFGSLEGGLEVVAVTQPMHGTASVSSASEVLYAPAPGFIGTDAFTYTLREGGETVTGAATVRVLPGSGAPPAPAFEASQDGRRVTLSGPESQRLRFWLEPEAARDTTVQLTLQLSTSAEFAAVVFEKPVALERDAAWRASGAAASGAAASGAAASGPAVEAGRLSVSLSYGELARVVESFGGGRELAVWARLLARSATGLTATGPVSGLRLALGVLTANEAEALPTAFALHGNYPNPFNPSTTIRIDLPAAAEVSIEVVDLLGRRVLALPGQALSAGAGRAVQVDAGSLASGAYLYRVTARMAAGVQVATGRMLLVK